MCPACAESVRERAGFIQLHGSNGEFCAMSGQPAPWKAEAMARQSAERQRTRAPAPLLRDRRNPRKRQRWPKKGWA